MTIDQAQHADTHGMHLLFALGKRPTRAAIGAFVRDTALVQIAHDPFASSPILVDTDGADRDKFATNISASTKGVQWIELLREGLTFDLLGFAPGPSSKIPQIIHKFDLEIVPDPQHFEALSLNVGGHLIGAHASLPVAKCMMALAREMIRHFKELQAVVWAPSRSAIGRRFFESSITAWLEGGPFPALGLTVFTEAPDGALQTEGLAFWIGQELRIEQSLATDKVYATRLGVRIINQLILVGGLDAAERMMAPDGTQLFMRPSPNRRFIRVSRE